ncbi:MAG TPA: membrane protein insertion efficiency factor YidD [Methylomirabilota bacterium]|nr:membrane protein insertion efficiency factor YidD [Methylomirabilota bacterium]
MTVRARVGVLLIRGYQFLLRPLLPAACRYEPSCSQYAARSIMSHGLLRGGWLALKRIGRCHPWGPGGYDPPPGTHKPGTPGA